MGDAVDDFHVHAHLYINEKKKWFRHSEKKSRNVG
jgi:hypothetical protein